MCDDSEYIKEIYEFHPTNTPRGMLYYKLTELTAEQQASLNDHKIKIIRENQKYLHEHPEVKIITSALLKAVLLARPKYHIHKFLVEYLMDSWTDIQKEVDMKIAEKIKQEAMQKQRLQTIAYLKALYEEEGLEESNDILDEAHFDKMLDINSKLNTKLVCKSIIDEIINRIEIKQRHHVQIQVSSADSSGSDVQLEFVNHANGFDSDLD